MAMSKLSTFPLCTTNILNETNFLCNEEYPHQTCDSSPWDPEHSCKYNIFTILKAYMNEHTAKIVWACGWVVGCVPLVKLVKMVSGCGVDCVHLLKIVKIVKFLKMVKLVWACVWGVGCQLCFLLVKIVNILKMVRACCWGVGCVHLMKMVKWWKCFGLVSGVGCVTLVKIVKS